MEIPIVACPCGARFTDCLLTEPVHDPSSWKYRVACSLAPDATGAETAFFRIESAHFGKRPSPRVKADIRQHRTRITTLHVFQHDLGFDPIENPGNLSRQMLCVARPTLAGRAGREESNTSGNTGFSKPREPGRRYTRACVVRMMANTGVMDGVRLFHCRQVLPVAIDPVYAAGTGMMSRRRTV